MIVVGGSIEAAFARLRAQHWGGAKVRFESGREGVLVSVGTTATTVLPANPNRVAWAIANQNGNFGLWHWERSVSATRGFRLAQQGGTAQMRYDEDGETVQSAVFGISDTGAGDWYVVAWELDPA